MKKFCGTLICGVMLAASASITQAAVIAQYDLLQADLTVAPGNGSLAPSTVASGFTASNLTVNNAVSTVSQFGNHFYFDGWDTTVNASKYYETTLSSATPYTLGALTYSVEVADADSGSNTATFYLRSSLDGYVGNIDVQTVTGGLVTNNSVDLSGLGLLSGSTTFRWFVTSNSSTNIVGFANHQCDPGSLFDAGCGLADVGLDVTFNGVPAPATLALMGLGLAGIGYRRKQLKAA
jgi:hypothetical protein